MIRSTRLLLAVGALIAATAAGSTAVASGNNSVDGRSSFFHVELSGYEEDPQALSTAGSAQVWLRIDEADQEITFRLSYRDLEGGAVTAAHIHFGGRAQSGGISAFLCGSGPPGTQACPAAPATITGTIVPADIIGPAGQGIAAGEFDELVAAIRAGMTYANVHTEQRPAGEVRGQLDRHRH